MPSGILMKDQNSHIVQALQKRDKRVIEILYDQYSPALYGVILKIVRSEETACDVLQDTFIKIWTHGNQYDARKGTLFTWMLNIARNKAIDKTRSAAFKKKSKIQNLDQAVYNSVEQSEQLNPDHIGLKGMVDGLEDKYKEVIELAYFQGYTQKEIMERLDLPLGTVKSRVRIGLRELRRLFTLPKVSGFLLIWYWLIT